MRCDYCFYVYNEGDACPECKFKKGGPPDELFYLFPGTVIGSRYVVGKTLGAGGFGIVYKAWDNHLNKVVAVKEYYPSGLVTRTPGTGRIRLVAKNREAEFLAGMTRFNSECKGTMEISASYPYNPAIIHDVFTLDDNGTAYLAMEFVEGMTLTEYIEKNGPMSVEAALVLINNILGAVRDIHALNIIHRDISPDNIILTADQGAKLIDYGAAKFGKADRTVEAERIMKPGFSPPEQYEPKERSGVFTDIYSVGATLYFTLTGLKPDESTNRKDRDLLAAPISLVPTVAAHVSDAILRAMAVDFRLRYKTAAEFMQALNGQKKTVRPEAELRRRKVRRFASVAATFVVFIVIGIVTNFNIQARIDALNDASIEFWFVLTGDEIVDSSKEAMYGQVISRFNTMFPNIDIALVGVPAIEYAGLVHVALARGYPIMFESDGFTVEELAGAINLNPVAQAVSDDVFFLDMFQIHVPGGMQLPTGFSTSGIFLNTSISGFEGRSIMTLAELGTGIAVYSGYETIFQSMFGVSFELQETFFAESPGVGAIFASTAELSQIRAALPGRYRLVGLEVPDVPAFLMGYFSVANSSADERAAKTRLLEFMLSEYAQNLMHVQHESGLLPLNGGALTAFSVTFGDFLGFFENFDRFTVR